VHVIQVLSSQREGLCGATAEHMGHNARTVKHKATALINSNKDAHMHSWRGRTAMTARCAHWQVSAGHTSKIAVRQTLTLGMASTPKDVETVVVLT
jgi:hypothetical protein